MPLCTYLYGTCVGSCGRSSGRARVASPMGRHYGVTEESSRRRRTHVCNTAQAAHEGFANLWLRSNRSSRSRMVRRVTGGAERWIRTSRRGGAAISNPYL
jgi:hypothetical protein